MKKAILVGLLSAVSISQAAEKIPALDALKVCDIKAMPKTPVKLPGGLVIKTIKFDPAFKGQFRIKMTLNKVSDDTTALVKKATGYDFAYIASAKNGAVNYEHNEADPDNWLACYIVGPTP